MLDQPIICEDDFIPDVSNLVTEDDTPVDNFPSAKQQRLLVSSLYSSLKGQVFLSEANVGIFHTPNNPPIVPDVFLSLDVQVPENWWQKQHRSYFVWQFGKPPEVVIEIVSNKEGEELGKKLTIYEQMRVSYYIVYDPTQQLGESILSLFELRGRKYFEMSQRWLEQVDLGLTLWEGAFEGKTGNWLRWCDRSGNILLTGDERSQRLAEQLKLLGVNPDILP
jgi:Uma2 family endonuclease